MDEAHETLEGLRRLFSGQASPIQAEQTAAHLTGCRACWLLAVRAIDLQKASGEPVVPGPLQSVVDLHEMQQTRLEEWLDAQATWIEIRSLGVKGRRDKVRLTRSLHTLGFLQVLLAEGAAAAPADSEEVFYLALLVAGQLPATKFSVELKNNLCAECCAEIANARRRLAKWPAARDALKKGDEYALRGTKNGVVEGKLLCVAGALEDDLGNTEEAAEMLRKAVGLFEAAAETLLKGRTLTQLAYVLADLDPAEGVHVAGQALSVIPDNNPRLVWFAQIIRINCLITMGAPQEALLRFNDLKGLHDQFREPYMQVRGRFAAARLLEHLGRPQRAVSLFEEVIAGDLEHGLMKDFFLDLVYLFGFHLRRRQSSEAIAVCRRAGEELSLLEDEEGSGESAREQMRSVWRSLEEEVKRGNRGPWRHNGLEELHKGTLENTGQRPALIPEVKSSRRTLELPGTFCWNWNRHLRACPLLSSVRPEVGGPALLSSFRSTSAVRNRVAKRSPGGVRQPAAARGHRPGEGSLAPRERSRSPARGSARNSERGVPPWVRDGAPRERAPCPAGGRVSVIGGRLCAFERRDSPRVRRVCDPRGQGRPRARQRSALERVTAPRWRRARAPGGSLAARLRKRSELRGESGRLVSWRLQHMRR